MTIKLRAFLTVLIMVLLSNSNSAFGLDTSDTTPPVVTYKLIQDLPSKGNLVIFEVVVTDDKNEIVIQGGRIYAAVMYAYDSTKLQVAPICQSGGQTDFVTQLIPRQTKSIRLPDGRYQAVFDLLMYMVRPGEMPSGCPDWRQGNAYIYTNAEGIRDAAGNRTFVIPSSGSRRAEFTSSPFAAIVDRLNLAENKHYCFNIPYGDWEQDYLQRLLTAYRDGVKPHIGKSYAKDIVAEFDKKFPRFEIVAQQYLLAGKNAISVDQLNKLELCQWFVRPWTEDLQANVMYTSRALTSASSASATSSSKKLTCVKGKSTLVVTGKNPTCPKGYKKK